MPKTPTTLEKYSGVAKGAVIGFNCAVQEIQTRRALMPIPKFLEERAGAAEEHSQPVDDGRRTDRRWLQKRSWRQQPQFLFSSFLQICNNGGTTLVIYSTTAEASSSYLTTQTGVSTHQEATLKLVLSLLLGPLRYCYTQILLVFFTSKRKITKSITKLIKRYSVLCWYKSYQLQICNRICIHNH